MIMDGELRFSNAQAITATANSENVIDITTARDIGVGEEMEIVIQVDETFDDSGDDSTVAVTLVTDDNSALSSTATVATLVTLAANTAAGYCESFKIPSPMLSSGAYQRYIALTYTLANGSLSAGKISAYIVKNADKYTAYPAGYSIS